MFHVLRRWDEQPHVTASNPHDDWGWETELKKSLDWRQSLIAEIDGDPIGFLEIIDPARDDVERRRFNLDDCFVYRLTRGDYARMQDAG